jgi:hypothetical protein
VFSSRIDRPGDSENTANKGNRQAMNAALSQLESGIAAAFRIAEAAPTPVLFGPAAALAALLTARLAGLRLSPAA